MNGYKRTHYCGTLTKANAGQTVQLSGWVQRARDLGGVVFVWLRDREGIGAAGVRRGTSVPTRPVRTGPTRCAREYVVTVRRRSAHARARTPSTPRPAHGQGGGVRARVPSCSTRAETPPIYIDDKAEENETVRLKYRYLDLRKPSLQRNMRMRAKIAVGDARRYMDGQGFAEVETPDADQVHARGRARFPRAQPRASRPVLRAAAVAADLQAASHAGGL